MRLSDRAGVRPHGNQAITRLPLLLSGCWDADGEPCTGGRLGLIVLALDGVGFEVADQLWTPDVMIPLSTTFPSTSSSAWLSAVTGKRVDEHLVPGVRYRLPGISGLIDCFDDGPWGSTPQAGRPVIQTVFDRLAARGISSLVIPGEVSTWGAAWLEALCHGAHIRPSEADWAILRQDPLRLTRVLLRELHRALSAADSSRWLFWCWIDLDDAIHLRGYADDVLGALTEIEEAAIRWRELGHTVIAVSDHGLVPTFCTSGLADAWARATAPALCRLPPGGAGRVRWCYPRRRRGPEVSSRLAGALGETALVVEREELADLGLLRLNRELRARLGEIVAISAGVQFPVPDPRNRFEHGGVTPAEMIVPLAVWLPGGGAGQ
jgi:hypothetical protein